MTWLGVRLAVKLRKRVLPLPPVFVPPLASPSRADTEAERPPMVLAATVKVYAPKPSCTLSAGVTATLKFWLPPAGTVMLAGAPMVQPEGAITDRLKVCEAAVGFEIVTV